MYLDTYSVYLQFKEYFQGEYLLPSNMNMFEAPHAFNSCLSCPQTYNHCLEL